MTAALPQAEGRKVRAPQDRVLGNSQQNAVGRFQDNPR
jgi:hypothetical protein